MLKQVVEIYILTSRLFYDLFQNPRESIAASIMIDHSHVTSAANVIRGRTPWQGIYVKDVACCRNTSAQFAAGNSDARIICYAMRTTSTNKKIRLPINGMIKNQAYILKNAITATWPINRPPNSWYYLSVRIYMWVIREIKCKKTIKWKRKKIHIVGVFRIYALFVFRKNISK